jgi:lycopene beta-cyclase
VLRARPDLGPSLFMDLFSRADPARVIRFLSDKGTLADHLAMITALPARPFLSALLAAHGRPSVRGATP